ncbi:MAG: ketol-acid reductoisomerase [Armatimonadetes bacterium]|nr:ketol-acid reductoisomerase [Candidatus Hippobium faecium]
MLKTHFTKDLSFDILKDRTIAIIGYGSQGHAHAQNLRDRGLNVLVANHKDTPNGRKAVSDGFQVLTAGEAAQKADFIMMLAPDEKQAEIYRNEIEPYMTEGKILAFGHGFNIHYGLIKPKENIDVILVACKSQGHKIREAFLHGGALTCLYNVCQNFSGKAEEYALAYAKAVETEDSTAMECSFREETVTNLFGEQTVLVGGLMELIKAGFETLVKAGYSPETAYFETCHEVKLLTDIIFKGGLTKMVNGISNTAMYGGFLTGPEIIGKESRKAMETALKNIEDGSFAQKFITDIKKENNLLTEKRKETEKEEIEQIGLRLRQMLKIQE